MAKKKHKQPKFHDEERGDSPQSVSKSMFMPEAVDVIREELIRHRLSGRKTLWSTILMQIAEQNSFDGQYALTILEVVRSFLKPLDDQAIISLWRQTETGMGDDTDDECLFPDCCRMDLEMELLQETTNLAWAEAKDASD